MRKMKIQFKIKYNTTNLNKFNKLKKKKKEKKKITIKIYFITFL